MCTNKGNRFTDCICLFALILAYISFAVGVRAAETANSTMSAEVADFAAFQSALEVSDDVQATSIGDLIFGSLSRKYPTDAGFGAFKSKLNAAVFLAGQMKSQLKAATDKRIITVTKEILNSKNEDNNETSLVVAPAKSFYDTSVKLFSRPIRIAELADEEKMFLAQYYDLNLRSLTSAIAKAGQALAIAEPTFKGTHEYTLVLPLLHASDKKAVNIEVLPRWMRHPAQLSTFSDSCLLHFGFPFHAMMIAKKAAQIQQLPFAELEFYRSAAAKCGESRAHIAVDCLLRAMDYAPDEDPDTAVFLRFDIVQVWLDSGNYALAAGQAREVFENYPDHEQSGRAIWLYHYGLSRSNKSDEILAHIDKALKDRRCEAYTARLMYVKWWALRRQRGETAKLAAIEYELLRLYGNNPMVAPVLLSRATDFLARQDYNRAYESLSELVERFPSTKSAQQAKATLTKLKARGMAQ